MAHINVHQKGISALLVAQPHDVHALVGGGCERSSLFRTNEETRPILQDQPLEPQRQAADPSRLYLELDFF
jgi:hypothetical protein